MNPSPIILFDGVCNFCNGAVNFIIRQDKRRHMRFAALQSTAGQALLRQYHLPLHDFETFILIDKDKAYQKSTAALKVARYLPWYWQWLQIFRVVPRFIRDAVYNYIATHRYHWFGKQTACMLPSPEVKERFLE